MNKETSANYILQLATNFVARSVHACFSLDRNLKFRKFHRDIFVETNRAIVNSTITLRHYFAYVKTSNRGYFESMILYESTALTVTTSTQKIRPTDWR